MSDANEPVGGKPSDESDSDDLTIRIEGAGVDGDATVLHSEATIHTGVRDSGHRSGARDFGRYRLIRELGAGGQGQVYLAEDRELHREVAFKVLGRSASLSDMARMRFRREAETASKLSHPNICTIFEFGEFEGLPFMAMQLVEGYSLSERIRHSREGGGAPSLILVDQKDSKVGEASGSRSRTRGNGVAAVAVFVEKVARALHAAHEVGLVHRDIKSGNIMVDRGGEPVILDFGLARDESSTGATLTQSGDILGTPAYMAPEQISLGGTHMDRRSDVYALGVVLYECLTLQHPFSGHSLDALYQAILNREPTAPRRLNPAVSRDLETVVMTALDKDRDRRYQSAVDLAEDLRRVREHEPILARPVGPIIRLRRWAQRRPALAALVLLLIVTVPTIAALTSRHFAMLPQVHRQQAAERRQAVEDHLSAGMLHIHRGRWKQGLASLRQALQLDPDSAEAVGTMARTLVERDPARGLALLDEHAALVARYPALEAMRARILRRLGRDDEAARIEIEQAQPTDDVGWYLRGCLELAAGSAGDQSAYDRGLDAFLTASMMSPVARVVYLFQAAAALNYLERAADPKIVARVTRALTTVWADHAKAWYYAGVINQDAHPERAVEYYKRSLAIEPDAFTNYNLALSYESLGMYDECIAEYREAIRRYPRYAVARTNLGIVLRGQGKLDEAIEQFRLAIESDPMLDNPRSGLAAALSAAGRTEEAAIANQEAIRVLRESSKRGRVHDRARDLFNLGLRLTAIGKPEEAVEAYREATRIAPDQSMAHTNLAALLTEMGRMEEAATHLREAIAIDPDLPQAQFNLGNALQALGHIEEAVTAHAAAARLAPKMVITHEALGGSLHAAGKLKEAEAALREAVALAPGYEPALFKLALVLEDQKKTDEAVAIYRRLGEIAPMNLRVFHNLGRLHLDRGELDAAVAAFERCLELAPRDPRGRAALAVARRKQGRLEEAVAGFRAALRLGTEDPVIRNMCVDAVLARAESLDAEGRLDDAIDLLADVEEQLPDEPRLLKALDELESRD